MTFGLAEAAFHERLISAVRDTRLHPDYGLIADPKWDADTLSALFPFMVYEAKPLGRTRRFGGLNSWSDPDEVAWKQVTPAARLYLSLQESLIRVPGSAEKVQRPLQAQSPSQCEPRVFIVTSVGSHWTIYSLHPTNDHAETFYTWTDDIPLGSVRKVWESHVNDERSAWELLYHVDEIQRWAKTAYRDMIRHYLSPWHAAVEKNILFEWRTGDDGQRFRRPRGLDHDKRDYLCIRRISVSSMPFWAMSVDETWRKALNRDAGCSFTMAYVFTEEGKELAKTWKAKMNVTQIGRTTICSLEDEDFIQHWLAGPGRKWQE
jgi:hypothetical protein